MIALWYSTGMRKKKLEVAPQQQEEVKDLARRSQAAHVRVKALAVYNVGMGVPRHQVARLLQVERRSVGRWVENYLAHGVAGFGIKPGRGRRSLVDAHEVEHYLRQAPRQFGLSRTRWTLALLGQVVPSLRGMTEAGVRE